MQFIVKDRVINKVDSSVEVISDNADYTASFTFDAEWTGVTKTARFITTKNGQYVDVVLVNDACQIPLQILHSGFFGVGVYSAEMTTTECQVYVKASIKEKHGTEAPPQQNIYEQILAVLDTLKEIGENGVDSATLNNAIQDYMSTHPVSVDLSDYATKQYVSSAVSTIVPAYIGTAVQNYITAHQSELTGEQGLQGEQGSDGLSAYEIAVSKGYTGTENEWIVSLKGANGQDGERGLQGIQGPAGEGFSIFKTYASISAMNADLSNVAVGKFVMISSTVEDEDNAKLYVRAESTFNFVTDMSGAKGVKGDTGEQGVAGANGTNGTTPVKGVDYFDGADGYTPVRGTDYWTATDIQSMKDYIDEAILGGTW